MTYRQAIRLLRRTHHRGYLLYREGQRWDGTTWRFHVVQLSAHWTLLDNIVILFINTLLLFIFLYSLLTFSHAPSTKVNLIRGIKGIVILLVIAVWLVPLHLPWYINGSVLFFSLWIGFCYSVTIKKSPAILQGFKFRFVILSLKAQLILKNVSKTKSNTVIFRLLH